MNSKDTFFSSKRSLNLGGRLLSFPPPQVMGILNITPDSFYAGSRRPGPSGLPELAAGMLEQGASILDVGAVSTRPGAGTPSEEEELGRLRPALDILRRHHPDALISVDTWRSAVARAVVEEFGVDMINDVSGGQMDPGMYETIASLQVPYVLMHMRGTPSDMQKHTRYDDLFGEILGYFSDRIHMLGMLGINDIIVDPGFGFAKTIDQNFRLLSHLEEFRVLEKVLMVGISRKSMIYKTLGISPEEAMNGSTALNTVALLGGADILRVHDVKEAMEVIQLAGKLEMADRFSREEFC